MTRTELEKLFDIALVDSEHAPVQRFAGNPLAYLRMFDCLRHVARQRDTSEYLLLADRVAQSVESTVKGIL